MGGLVTAAAARGAEEEAAGARWRGTRKMQGMEWRAGM